MKNGFLRVAAATPNILVADTEHNKTEIIGMMIKASADGAKLVVFPELCVTGYTCSDLFLHSRLLDAAEAALLEIAEASRGLDALFFVGAPLRYNGLLYNCAVAVYNGELLGAVPKTNLPNYGEFYEKRWFSPADEAGCGVISLGGDTLVLFGTDMLFCHESMPELRVAAEICEDIWVPSPPSSRHAMAGATVIVNLSASNETVTKDDYRRSLVASQSGRCSCGYVYASAGAGESTTDLVFAGHNLICENGVLLAESSAESGITYTELDIGRIASARRRLSLSSGDAGRCHGYTAVGWGGELSDTALTRYFSKTPFVPENEAERARRCEKILELQSLGLKKRMQHTGSKCAVLGVSGGLDSTLALIVTARALDMLSLPRSGLLAVTMPCFGTTERTKSNAVRLAEELGATLRVVDIGKAVTQHFEDIGHSMADTNVTFENAQARERTQVLMDLANDTGGLVIGTGDMSELALGWATYNGDSMSMYGVNSGVPKTLVRHLVSYYADSCGSEPLSATLRDVLDTPVSPELLPAENGEISQKTEDIVGPYELHDFFLYYLVRWGFPPKKVFELAKYAFAGGYDDDTILKWLRTFVSRFFAQQFKRSCLPDGPKIGSLSLSPRGDLRMPSDASAALWLKELEGL